MQTGDKVIKQLLYKWFGIEDKPCATCEVLKEQLALAHRENQHLLEKLLEKKEPVPEAPLNRDELKPILPQHIPWRVRQQMLEAEDRIKAQKLKEKQTEISDLEKELGVDKVG